VGKGSAVGGSRRKNAKSGWNNKTFTSALTVWALKRDQRCRFTEGGPCGQIHLIVAHFKTALTLVFVEVTDASLNVCTETKETNVVRVGKESYIALCISYTNVTSMQSE